MTLPKIKKIPLVLGLSSQSFIYTTSALEIKQFCEQYNRELHILWDGKMLLVAEGHGVLERVEDYE